MTGYGDGARRLLWRIQDAYTALRLWAKGVRKGAMEPLP